MTWQPPNRVTFTEAPKPERTGGAMSDTEGELAPEWQQAAWGVRWQMRGVLSDGESPRQGGAMKNIRLVKEDCTCALVRTDAWRDGLYAVMYCPLHDAAREMYALLDWFAHNDTTTQGAVAMALLARIDGGAR